MAVTIALEQWEVGSQQGSKWLERRLLNSNRRPVSSYKVSFMPRGGVLNNCDFCQEPELGHVELRQFERVQHPRALVRRQLGFHRRTNEFRADWIDEWPSLRG